MIIPAIVSLQNLMALSSKQVGQSLPSVHIYDIYSLQVWLIMTKTDRQTESREEGRQQAKIHEDKIRENQGDDASAAGSDHSPGAHMDNRFPPFASFNAAVSFKSEKQISVLL